MLLPRVVCALRIGCGLLAVAALTALAWHAARTGRSLPVLFSSFAVESAVAAAVVLLWGGLSYPLRRWRAWFVPDLLRGAVTLYLLAAGLVHAVSPLRPPAPHTLAWADAAVHQVLPLVLLADWLTVPPYRRLHLVEAARWLAWPVLYLAAVLLAGQVVHGYPYPFTDPRPGGYLRVLLGCALLSLIVTGLAMLVARTGNALGGRRTGTPP